MAEWVRTLSENRRWQEVKFDGVWAPALCLLLVNENICSDLPRFVTEYDLRVNSRADSSWLTQCQVNVTG